MSTFDVLPRPRRGNSGLLGGIDGREQLFPVMGTGLDKACLPGSVSGQKSCVKGGVFFPISELLLSGHKVARKT